MTDILCNWLNNEVKLSKHFEKATLAEDLASGYYLGELLHKFQLQNDFGAFSTGKTADAKLNNFTRLEPSLNLLQIPFDSNIAYDIMMLKHGIATRLLYQLYIAIQRKVKSNMTGVAMKTMRAAAPVRLEAIESGLYKERLKILVPRESDLSLENVSSSFLVKQQEIEHKALKDKYKEMENFERVRQEQRQKDIEKSRETRQKKTELLAKIQAATVHIPKPPPSKTLKASALKQENRRKKEAASTFSNIEKFEKHLKKLVAPAASNDEDVEGDQGDGSMESSIQYMQRIKTRLEEDATAREERAKRRRKVLVDQLKAHHTQEEALREEQVVQKLMRQSQQERRIAVQLMQARREKDTIRKNRINQEKQNEVRRLKDFREALDKEMELCKQAKEDYEEEIKREKELHERIMSERARDKYRRHYDLCQETLGSIIDLSCKIGEYRELTEKKVPEKFFREWKELVLAGQPLYVEENSEQVDVDFTKQELLDSQDFTEYKNMIGEWIPTEESGSKPTPLNNNILGHILHRMFHMVAPTPPPTPPPVFPEFPIRAAVLGKMFSGKSTALSRLCQNHRIVQLSVDQLLTKAIEAAETMEIDTTTTLRSVASMPKLEMSSPIVAQSPLQSPSDAKDQTHVEGQEGEEKQDPQKQVLLDELGREVTKIPSRKFSLRATLGYQAMDNLKKGEAVPDSVLVEIIMEEIRKIPDGTGWVLDGFPKTPQQVTLLEKALTGKDVSVETPSPRRKGSKKLSLVTDAKPQKESVPIVSGLDLIVVLDVDDELVLKRAHGRKKAKESGEVYHEEFRPPPTGSQTGHGNEKVFPVEDSSYDTEQVQHRLSSFHNNWPKLSKLYSSISTVRHVDADAPFDSVYTDLEQCLFETLDKLQRKADTAQEDEQKESAAESQPKTPPTPSPAQPTPPAVEELARPGSSGSKKSKKSSGGSKTSPKGSARGRGKSNEKSEKGKSRSRSGSGKKSPKGKKKSRSPSPQPVVEAATEEPTGPPPPQPGDPDWEYVNEDISLSLVHTLVPYWENTESNYMKTTKFIFRQIRSERENIVRYLYTVRKDFQKHLKRPDHKQIYVSSWQKDYNQLAEDLRSDEESKAELHQRLDDLRETLWEICDKRKEEIESERSNLMTEGWMEDHLGILTNHYLTLMQAEIDRFQDTVNVLKDYYSGMQTRIPGEIGPVNNFIRMPLVELDMGGQETSATHSGTTIDSDHSSVSMHASQVKTAKKSSEELAYENEAAPGASLTETGSRTKIPLVQRGASITANAEDTTKGKKGKAAPPPQSQGTESPSQEDNLEEKTISEAFNFAANVVTATIQSRLTEKEAEEEEERKQKEEEEKAKAALAPPDKKAPTTKKGGKSAKGKKGKGTKSKSPTPTPPPVVEEESEEDKMRKATAIRLKDEYFAALAQEEVGVKIRLDLIRHRASRTLVDLRNKSEQAFTDMNDWLGARYLREMAAIDSLSNVARFHIERGEKLKAELRLEQDEFIINSERKVVATPTPPPRPDPVESALPDIFTVVQLTNLHAQFKEVAPGGMIINKAFIEIMADTAALTHGLDALPEMWMNVSYTQLLDLCNLLSPQSEYIDWRKFLLLAAQPWPMPSIEDLLEVRKTFVEIDVAGNGWITKDQYDQVDLWFVPVIESRPESPEDIEEPYPYNRVRNLNEFIFTLFADWEQLPPRLDYINMLIYFAMDKDNLVGTFRALSVSSGELMPNFVIGFDASLLSDKELAPEDAIASDAGMDLYSSPFKRSHLELEPTPCPLITPDMWWLVLHHGSSRLGDSHRFSLSEDPEEKYSLEQLRHIYDELGPSEDYAIPIQTLMRHTVLQEAVSLVRRHNFPDIASVFVQQTLQALDEDPRSDSIGIP